MRCVVVTESSRETGELKGEEFRGFDSRVWIFCLRELGDVRTGTRLCRCGRLFCAD